MAPRSAEWSSPRPATTAVLAAAAFRDGRDQLAIADPEPLDRLTDRGDGADRLVAEDAPIGHRRDVAFENVQVGATDRHGIDAIVIGPGDIAQAHAADEFVALEDLEWAIELYCAFVH